MIKKYFVYFIIVILIGVIVFLIWNRVTTKPKIIYKTLTKEIPVTKTQIKYKTLTNTKVLYIPKTEVKTIYKTVTKETNLPKILEGKKVLAIGKVPPYKGETLTICSLNKEGKGELTFQQLPYKTIRIGKPFISWKQHTTASFAAGTMFVRTGGAHFTTETTVRNRFLRIGKIGFYAQVSKFTNPSTEFAGVGIEFKF